MAYIDMTKLENIRADKVALESDPTVRAYLAICAEETAEVAHVKDQLLDEYRANGFKSIESEHFKLHIRKTESMDMDKIGLDIISQLMTANTGAVSVSVTGFKKAQKVNDYLAQFDIGRLTKVAKLTAVLEGKE